MRKTILAAGFVAALLAAAGCEATPAGPNRPTPVPANPGIYHVGPNRPIKTVSELVARLQPGDIVEVDPGTYREAMKLKANGTKDAPITIRGAAGQPRPVFDAKNVDVSGKGAAPRGIFQIEGAYWVLEHLELKNSRGEGSVDGIRLLGSTNATIRDCYVHHCDVGIMGNDRETATIDSCEVAFNSTDKWVGFAHNFYMHGNRVVVRNSYIHDSPFGQNFKSRARYNELWYNWIVDSDEGEVGPVDEHARSRKVNTGLPNSNTLLVGNVIVSKPKRDGNPGKFILFGSELKDGSGHNGTLYLFNNTMIAGSDKIVFIQLHDSKASAVVRNNIFFGSNKILETPVPAVSVVGSNNWLPAGAKIPAGFTNSITGADPGFVDLAKRDFRLAPGSPGVDHGVAAALEYTDGDGVKHKLMVDHSPWPVMHWTARTNVGLPDLGAYELGAKQSTSAPADSK